ncbi:OmpA family protein [Flavihumibacter rivuli]|uniref:OmpA family protein n=1 Tax=Flavihumibacter rivuli TaxID=2838156 RepID=UPI001BDE1163|nr:OmpA family protein [Flavihumibacter rivuli]ULQ55422.1 OmpA family protein [Flavihumibacter rivuli]
MKKGMLAFSLLLALAGRAQEIKIVKDHYTVSGGLLGAANFSKFRITDNSNLDYNMKVGWGAGGWVNIPLGKVVSLEPQLMYNSLRYETDAATALLKNSNVGYLSLPVLFKIHAGKKLAFTLGPQFDFLLNVNDDNNNWGTNDVESFSTSLSGGIELFPHGKLTPYARYIHGLTNMDGTGNPNNVGKYYNQNIQAGLKFRLFGKHVLPDSDGDGVLDKDDQCPGVVGLARYQGCPIPDTDKDGVNDEEDKCKDVPGLTRYGGCPIPDTDKDGINDEDDKCKDVPGIAKYGGCPIPDTDKDGINDEEDKCPNEPGTAQYNGCPIPDRDNDGVNDNEDRCPDIAGDPNNGGCPTLEASKFNASNVQFATGSATLTAGAKKELDKAARILTEQYPQLKLEIGGHTDNTGKAETNRTLSQKRAEAVRAYLVKKGVTEDRMSAVGYGPDQPIDDNATKEGRAKNRRVEFKVSQ